MGAVHYEMKGEGPPVVLVAGLEGLGGFWRPVVDRLADRHRVISFDHPGVGASPAQGPQGIGAIVESVLDLAGRLHLDRFSVVGHSTGGLVAQALALDHAAAIGKVVLSCTWAVPDRRFRELFALRKDVLQQAGMTAYRTLGRLLAYPPAAYEEWCPAEPAGAAVPEQVALIGERIDMLLGYTREADLGSLRKPVLVLGSLDDQIVPCSHAESLAEKIPGARLVMLSGGHFPQRTRLDDYMSALDAFLDGA